MSVSTSFPHINAQFSPLSELFNDVTASTVLTDEANLFRSACAIAKALSLLVLIVAPLAKWRVTLSAKRSLLFIRLPLSQSFQRFKIVSAFFGSPISNLEE